MSVNNCHNVQNNFNTKIVHSKDLKKGCSSNWGADWARFVGKMYAQIVKVKNDPKGQSQSKSNQVVVEKQFKPTVSVQKRTAIPVSSLVIKNEVPNM